MKILSHSTMVERLRPLVGDNGWDYCILWKLSQDQRSVEWMGCCCSGTEASIKNGGALLSVLKAAECRDVMLHHQRTRACEALSRFPSSIPLDTALGIYAQVLTSNQPTWQIDDPDSTGSLETVGAKTRILVPIAGGLVELFVSKHVPEDRQITDFIMSQCNADFLDDNCNYTPQNNQQHATELEFINNPWNISSNGNQNNFQWDPSLPDQYASPLNLFDGSMGVQNVELDSTIDNGAATYHEQSMMTMQESAVVGQEKEPVKEEVAGRVDSGSEGSEDDEEGRPVGRNGKRHHSKNLMAERKRRKKLNDRLYALRALVPKITKMDRASILGDAIEYVMELQKQVKDLQDELENENRPEEAEAKQIESNYEMEAANPTELVMGGNGMELDESPNSPATNKISADSMKQGSSTNDEKGNQMEPQVEVKQLAANEFYLKVFCEHKAGGFARLMEAMSSLGLEVTNASVTTLQTLVLNVFRVQKRDNEMVQVDQVRDSLLELTRGSNGNWSELGRVPVNSGDYLNDNRHHHHHSNHQHHHLITSNHHQLHFLHHQP